MTVAVLIPLIYYGGSAEDAVNELPRRAASAPSPASASAGAAAPVRSSEGYPRQFDANR